MSNLKISHLLLVILTEALCFQSLAQTITITSPDHFIAVSVANGELLTYSVRFKDRLMVDNSPLGFEFQNEPVLDGNFILTGQKSETINETWKPVVRSKHAEILNYCNEIQLSLKEKSGLKREMVFFVRVFNDGVAFRYKLYRGGHIGSRKITRELTTFKIPADPKAWIVEYGKYSSSNESEFFEHPISYLTDKSIAGLPLLMDNGHNCWMAITEAKIDHYPGFYLGTNGTANQLTTKLVPLPGEPENGTKVLFKDDLFTPWRVLMIGDSPGKLIESEMIQNLNDPCAIKDPSWIRPGKSAWDHWWSGEVKMEMPVIKQYIDLAAEMGWPYMLVDWQWYGPFNTPAADITKWAPQIDMPEIIRYAKSRNVRILIWLYSSDVNRNSAYKKSLSGLQGMGNCRNQD